MDTAGKEIAELVNELCIKLRVADVVQMTNAPAATVIDWRKERSNPTFAQLARMQAALAIYRHIEERYGADRATKWFQERRIRGGSKMLTPTEALGRNLTTLVEHSARAYLCETQPT